MSNTIDSKTLPKGPLSAYFIFMKDNRMKIKETHPNFKPQEVTKELGKQWSSLSDKDKAKYTRLHEEAKASYNEKLRQMGLTDLEAKKMKKTEKTTKKDAKKTKRK